MTGVVVALAWLANRPVARWHVLSVAAAGCLWLDPWAVLEPGFQLSFAAVVAIFTLAPRVRLWLEGTSCPARLREPLAISSACTLATAPIAWAQFDRVALVGSLPANLVALPAVAPLLFIGIAATLVHPLSPVAATPLALAASVLGDYLVVVARFGAWLDAAIGGAVLGLLGLPFGVAARRRRGWTQIVARRRLHRLCRVRHRLAARAGDGRAARRRRPSASRSWTSGRGTRPWSRLRASRRSSMPALAMRTWRGGCARSECGGSMRWCCRTRSPTTSAAPQRCSTGSTSGRVLDPGLANDEQFEQQALAAARRHGVPVVIARRGLTLRAGALVVRVLGPRHVVPARIRTRRR